MGFDRRTFIQLSVGGTVGILFTPVLWKALDDVSIWTQNWPWIPKLKYGALVDQPAVSKLCDSGCAVKVRKAAGSAFGTEGNEDNPLSKGGICPICANGVQVMRSPNRVKGPMKKVGDSFEPITWEDAKAMLADKLAAASGKVAFISGDQTGTANEVFSGFLAGLGSEDYLQMPCDMQAASRAFNGVMGGEGQVAYDLENADFVLLAGADAMESWGPTVATKKAFAASHPVGEKASAKYVFASPVQTHTASVVDAWVPVGEESMPAFLLGIAYHLIRAGKTVNAADFGAFSSMVMDAFAPAKVEAATGVKGAQTAALAKQLMAASTPVVVPGGTSVATATAAFAVNMLLGSLKSVSEFPKAVESGMTVAERMSNDLLGWVNKGAAPAVTMVYEANPVYSLPDDFKTGFLVSFATEWNETAAKADLVLPNAFTYERFDDMQNPYGFGRQTYTAGVPVCRPSLDVMASTDFILDLAASMGIELGFESFAEVIAAKAEVVGADFDEEAGGLFEGDAVGADVSALGASVLARAAAPARGAGAVVLAPYSQLIVGSQKVATTPNAPCVISNSVLMDKTIVAMMCGVTAKKLGVADGSKIKLSGGNGEAAALVKINEGVLPGAVAVPLGLGHTVGDEFSKGVGDNVYKILTVRSEAATGATVWTGSTVNVAKM
ncbi:menaquinone reductase molybdopterin-binding-like subunit QrcB [Pseudodesulfovibrio senegalensis]|jgi:anaerobic selenocysteine-containing dehydrogenase|uniref:Molybdopterin-dependent oxidoreductase n=1 Tax=Pseudodesulfovibrio senegalensis TaxID=1721087 RepID=A0A6N6MZQ3_9BACT|nr:menaquinone reductase molybdopterin-binding-like subunit QrcB [Pseudodesulfovibrio senegalensis]KAB1440287.1 molybdopterin-dependent oxidoreductase [Pseudodesulfovibrio senegalensis]